MKCPCCKRESWPEFLRDYGRCYDCLQGWCAKCHDAVAAEGAEEGAAEQADELLLGMAISEAKARCSTRAEVEALLRETAEGIRRVRGDIDLFWEKVVTPLIDAAYKPTN